MTEPEPADLEHRFGALWEHNRHQDAHIQHLETWRARVEAVSAWRRWVLPVMLSVAGFALTVLNVFVLRHH